MSEEYDPFAEEVDFEELPEEDYEEESACHTQTSQVNDVDYLNTENESTPSAVASKRRLDDGEGEMDVANKKAKESPQKANNKSPEEKSNDASLSSKSNSDINDKPLFLEKKTPRIPETEQEKWLWKSGWHYVRKFLKPYLNDGRVASEDDLEKLSRKLAQKVYEKELAKGTDEMNSKNAKIIKKYIRTFFDRYKYYDSSSAK